MTKMQSWVFELLVTLHRSNSVGSRIMYVGFVFLGIATQSLAQGGDPAPLPIANPPFHTGDYSETAKDFKWILLWPDDFKRDGQTITDGAVLPDRKEPVTNYWDVRAQYATGGPSTFFSFWGQHITDQAHAELDLDMGQAVEFKT